MKIPFTKYHIFVLNEQRVLEIEQGEKNLFALRSLAEDYIPDIEQVITAMKAAKVGASAYGRRKKRRKVLRRLNELRIRMGLIEAEAA